MQNLGYYNGTIKPLNELLIPATDRAIYFGDGVYEVAFAINKHPFALDEHLNRFFESCNLLKINFSKSYNELKKLIMQLLEQEDSSKQKIYWQVSRGSAPRQHTFKNDITANLLITITQEEIKNMETQKFKLITVEDTRFLHCNIKTLNLIPSIMASQKAKEVGADEAVLYRGDFVTECAHSNISILNGNTLQTAPANNLILPGITRKHLIEICNNLNINVLEQPFTLKQLFDCDEAIVSASGTLFMGVESVDNTPIGQKNQNLLKQIQLAYKHKIKNECGQNLY